MRPYPRFFLCLALTAGSLLQLHAQNSTPPPPPHFAAPWLTYNTALASRGGSPVAMALGDFDGDGDLDVVTALKYGAGGFSFLRNEVAGRFAPAVVYGSNSRCSGIAVADLNGDGKFDVALSDSDGVSIGTSISVWLGNGNGTFGPRQVTSLGSGRIVPVGITAADIDGDGDKDLAVACYGSVGTGAIRWLKNNGDASFAAPVTIPVDDFPNDMASADLNGDGRPDLVVAHNGYSVTVLVNNGSGGFVAPAAYRNLTSDNWAGPLLSCVALGDVNGDGKVDILYGSTRTWDGYTGRVVQLRNDGNAAFSRAADVPMVTFTAGPVDIELADLNGDGALDILAASYSARADDGVCVMLNSGGGSYAPATMYPAGQATRAIAAGDVNGDGKVDVLTSDDHSNAVTVRINPGNGVFPTVPFDMAGSNQVYQDAADIDGDGDLDIFTSGPLPSADDGAIMRNNGSGRFARTALRNGQDGFAAGVLRDLNGDGYPDLLFNSANTAPRSDFFTAINDGHGNFGPITRWLVGSAGWGAIDAFDIDNDGDLDVIDCEALGAPGIGTGRFFIAINNGNGTFQQPYAYDQLPRRPDRVVSGDFNQDGKPDLAFTNQGAYGFDDSVYIVIGNGNGTFQPPVVYTVGRGPLYIVKGDFDRDGHLDLATLNSGYNNEGDETLTLLFGVGNGTFTRLNTIYAPFSPDLLGVAGLTAADIDGDGDLDLLSTGASNDVSVYLNNGSGTFNFPYRMGVTTGTFQPIYRDFNGDNVPDLAVLTSPPPIGFGGGVAILRGLSLAPVTQSVVSRKVHNGIPFDLPLAVTGPPVVESRAGSGANSDLHQIVLTFTDSITVESVSVASSNGAATATRSVNGNVVTVDLANVSDAQNVTVSLANVNNGTAGTNLSVPIRFLLGDVNGDSSVNAGDVLTTRARAGQTLGAGNFRTDFNLDGTINAADVTLVRARSGNFIP